MIESSVCWNEVGAAFEELVELEAPERSSRLEKIKLRNARLAEEVGSLLEAHLSAEGFLEERMDRVFMSMAPVITQPLKKIALNAGERLLHFEIVELLGEGSLAKVFLARDTELERLVALKITLNQNKEARTLAHFNIDGIVQVFSEHLAEHSGLRLRLICLQFVAGPTLAQFESKLKVHEGPSESLVEVLEQFAQRNVIFEPAALKWRELLGSMSISEGIVLLGMRIAERLSHAHALGVLHLDIKPANILIDSYGRPYLSDFNVSSETQHLSSGDYRGVGGTPYYMSPEQARLFAKDAETAFDPLDGRADIYALGLVLKDLLRSLGFFDQRLLTILNRATEVDLQRRTPTAARLAKELGAWLRSYQAGREMPRVWRSFAWICQWPMTALISLTILSQIVASVINIFYNHSQIVSRLSAVQTQTFFKCVAFFNSMIYPVSIATACYLMRDLFPKSPDRARARRVAVRVPLIMFTVISMGWLPGAVFFPSALDYLAGPIPASIYWQFFGSFLLAWLISLTTTLTMNVLIVARALYPKYWDGDGGLAADELRFCQRLNRSMTFAAALVPMSGILLAVLLTSQDLAPAEYRSLKVFLLVVVGFGLTNLLLIERLTLFTARTFSVLKRIRPLF